MYNQESKLCHKITGKFIIHPIAEGKSMYVHICHWTFVCRQFAIFSNMFPCLLYAFFLYYISYPVQILLPIFHTLYGRYLNIQVHLEVRQRCFLFLRITFLLLYIKNDWLQSVSQQLAFCNIYFSMQSHNEAKYSMPYLKVIP